MRKLSEGAEAKVFSTRLFGVDAVVKQRHAKAYRIKELDETLRATRTRKEAKAMLRAYEAGVNVPRILGVGKFSIYMERKSGRLMKDSRMKDMDFRKLGSLLALMHGADVVHGDFTPANVMIHGKELCVIDFGLSDISSSVEDKALDLLLMKRSVGEPQYRIFARAYAKGLSNSKQILARLAEVERRGRYQTRTLA